MIKRIAGLGITTLAVTAGTLGLTTASAQAAGDSNGEVVSKTNLATRSAPTTVARVVGSSEPGTHLALECKKRGPMIDGNNKWYRLPGQHNWVSARYVANIGSPPGWCGHAGDDSASKISQDPGDQADQTVRAWGRGDRHQAGIRAQHNVVAKLFDHANPGGKHWRRSGSEGAMGTYYYTYRNDTNGAKLVLGVTNENIPGAKTPAVRTARFV